MATKKKVVKADGTKVLALIKKAAEAKTADEAVQYSNAAQNAAQALYSLELAKSIAKTNNF